MTTTQSSTGKWAEPPARKGPAYPWKDIAKTLRKNPGKWRLIFERDRTSLTIAIRNGGIAALKPEDGFEVRTTNNKRKGPGGEPPTCSLYLRYNPEGED